MRLSSVLVLSIALFLVSCAITEEDLVEVKLVDDFRLEQLPDGSYLIGVRSIFIDQNSIYLADPERNQVVVLDEQGTMVSYIGQAGRGPGELMYPGQLYLNNDTLFVFSGGKHSIDLFSKGQFVKTIPFNNLKGMYAGGRFFVDSGNVFVSVVDLEGCISVLPINNMNKKRSFGQLMRFNTDKQTIIQNQRQVFLYENNNTVISVSFTQPKVEKYSKEGILLETLSFENLEVLDHRIQYAVTQLSIENVAVNLVADAYLFNDQLYILLHHSNQDKVFANKILQIDLGGKKMKLKKIIDLGPSWFTSFGVSNQYLWAFCSDHQSRYLARFPLSQQGL